MAGGWLRKTRFERSKEVVSGRVPGDLLGDGVASGEVGGKKRGGGIGEHTGGRQQYHFARSRLAK